MGALRTPVPRSPSRPEVEGDEGSLELLEVPATVVCATCGLPECSCEVDRPSAFSGVVAIVPWERPGGTLLSRLWATAKLATLAPEAFFAALPPGGALAPLGFAVLAELLAALGLCLTFGGLALMLLPAIGATLMESAALRGSVTRIIGWAVPGLALVMVLLHLAHGVALDRAARQHGSRQPGLGVRFGLYACGWDLVTLPLGLLLLTVTDGPFTALRHSGRGVTAPGRAALAYLTHVHRLDHDAAQRSQRSIAVVLTPVVAALLFALIGAWLWAARR
jgi:hypothetical protein